MLHSDFLAIRAQPDEIVPWQFDNVTFILNAIDSLTGDESLIGIRKRQTRHSTLKMVEQTTEEARQKVTAQRDEFDDKFEEARKEAEERFKKSEETLQQRVDDMQQRAKQSGAVNQGELMAAVQRLAVEQSNTQRRIQVETEALRRERDKAVEKIENELDGEINRVQTKYKLYAGFLPIIPPLVVGGIVWLLRRSREREGITAVRRR
jgi:ABC-2 type transport system permease protein